MELGTWLPLLVNWLKVASVVEAVVDTTCAVGWAAMNGIPAPL